MVFAPHSMAQEKAQEPEQYVKVRLLSERSAVGPGQDIWIGIEQSIHPGWHTYWRNPGDSGSAPRVDWTLPDDWKISDIHWPAPEKIPYDPLLNYGYSGNVILLQKLTTPPIMKGGPVTLTADFEVLVCKEICIPEFGTYTLTLNDPENMNENNEAYLASAREKLPVPSTVSAVFSERDGTLEVRLSEWPEDIAAETLELFPLEWGLIENTAPLQTRMDNGALILSQDRADRPLNDIKQTDFVITGKGADGNRHAYQITASAEGTPAPGTESSPLPALLGALFFALLGGMILNLMPCVFPVLSLKALSLSKNANKKDQTPARRSGLAYTAGVVLSFLAIAGILIALKAAGAQIGWGFQLQNPVVVSLLAYLLFIIGLNLSGLFEISGHFGNVGNKLTQGTDITASFFSGVLATIVATPCTAPFMAAALGYALTQPAYISLLIFAVLGLGLALPYLALSYTPSLGKMLPKPGKWMETFRQLLAFPMFASAAWLVWVVSQQTGSMGMLGVLMGLVLIAFAFWLIQHQPKDSNRKILVLVLAALTFLTAFALLPKDTVAVKQQHEISFGEPFSHAALNEYLQGDDPVFVEMTAAWCITCKANHKIAIDIPQTRQIFAEKNVKYLVGDWTNQDPNITEYLNTFDRNGVPLYVYYGPRDDVTKKRPQPNVLPQLLTPGIVKDRIK